MSYSRVKQSNRSKFQLAFLLCLIALTQACLGENAGFIDDELEASCGNPEYSCANADSGSLTLHIKALTGQMFDVNINPDETIFVLKKKIECKEGIPFYQQRLIKNGIILHCNRRVSDYSIPDGSNINLDLGSRPGRS